jgi:hypothetical protein
VVEGASLLVVHLDIPFVALLDLRDSGVDGVFFQFCFQVPERIGGERGFIDRSGPLFDEGFGDGFGIDGVVDEELAEAFLSEAVD